MHPTVTRRRAGTRVPVARPPRPAVRVRRRAPVRDPRGRARAGSGSSRASGSAGSSCRSCADDRARHGRDVRAEQPRARRSRGGRADRRVSEPSPRARDEIVAAARQILETDGREGLTMRALAARLEHAGAVPVQARRGQGRARGAPDRRRPAGDGDGAPRVARRARPRRPRRRRPSPRWRRATERGRSPTRTRTGSPPRGNLPRDLLPEGLEAWTAALLVEVAGDEDRARADLGVRARDDDPRAGRAVPARRGPRRGVGPRRRRLRVTPEMPEPARLARWT